MGPTTAPGAQAAGAPVRDGAAATLLIGLAALALLAPLLAHGPLPRGSDVFAHNHYLIEFSKALSEGDLWPRWTEGTNQGLGAPSFVMLPPLFYYLASAASVPFGSPIAGTKLTLILLAALTGLCFYLLAREWIGPGVPAGVGAALYLLLPYHVLDIYQRYAMSEITAFVFFPLILLFARRTLEGGSRRDFAGLSLTFAGLLYAHLVSALLFSLLLVPWLVWEVRGRWGALLRPLVGFACGLGLSAPCLLPAVVEKADANIAWVREMPNGDFRANFIFKDEPLPGLGFKDPVKQPVLRSAHSQLLLGLAAAWVALALTFPSEVRRRRDAATLAVGCGAAYFMQLEISTPLWKLVPELASIQFPWRFQTVMVLAAALLVAMALRAAWPVGSPATISPAGKRRLGLGLLLVLVAINLGLAAWIAFLKPFDFSAERLASPGVVHWIEPAFTPVQFKAYRTFKRRRVSVPRAVLTGGGGNVSVVTWQTSRRVLEIDSASGGRVEVGTFWFPGWTGRLDGSSLELRPLDPYATIGFDVPPGRHTVELRFEATPVRGAAGWIGFASIFTTIACAWWLPHLRFPVTGVEPAAAARSPGGP